MLLTPTKCTFTLRGKHLHGLILIHNLPNDNDSDSDLTILNTCYSYVFAY